MERNSQVHALILSSKNIGEDHRLITIFSKEKGVFTAMQFGGRKSKLRSMIQPFHFGKMWLYTDSVKNQTKITDFHVESYRPSLRESLEKNWAANICLELVLKTHCGGDNENGFTLVNAFLDGLDFSQKDDVKVALIRFLWRFLGLMGQRPDVSFCGKCGKPLTTIGLYDSSELCFFCTDCTVTDNNSNFTFTTPSLSGEALRFLENVSKLSPKESRNLSISSTAISQLQNILFSLIEKSCDTKLKTLESLMIIT